MADFIINRPRLQRDSPLKLTLARRALRTKTRRMLVMMETMSWLLWRRLGRRPILRSGRRHRMWSIPRRLSE